MNILITKQWLLDNTYREDKKTIAINNAQAKILGISFSNNKGWMQEIIGKTITKDEDILFRLLKNVNGKKRQKVIVDRYKNSLISIPKISDKHKIKRLKKIIAFNKIRAKRYKLYIARQKKLLELNNRCK